jgi:O-antigen ligase
MGRFLNPKALKTVRSEPMAPAYRPPRGSVAADDVPISKAAVAEEPPAAAATLPEQPRSMLDSVGLISLGFFVVSPVINDMLGHVGARIYISAISASLLAIAFLVSGSAGRGLKLPIGRYWVLFSILLACTVPFSTWPSASLGQLEAYIPRGILLFFAITAFVVDVSSVKFFFLMQTIAGLLLLINCALWGGVGAEGDRFSIVQSYFYSNSNDLALGLTTTVGFFLYLLAQKNVSKWLLGTIAFIGDVYFLLKTGSRGGFVAMGAVIAFSVFFSARYRSRLLVMLVFLPVLVFAIPQDTLHRLTYIFANPITAGVRTESDEAAVQSQIERTELFWKSVHLMGSHPLLGVGVGEFPDAVYANDLENRTRSPALGTHNSYTQVGAECGIPALIVYLLIVFTGIRMNYRIFRRTLADERLAFFPLAALCLLTSSLGYAVGSTFHHVAWSGILPTLTGATAGLWQACQKEAAKVGSPNLLTEEKA